jgi:hypothetical protein
MAEKIEYLVTPRGGKPTVLTGYAAANALEMALRTVLLELAKFHGNAPGPWLDDLEKVVIGDAKGSVAEGVPIEAEADALQFSVDVLKASLNFTRDTLAAK